jgi:hypothetical protein
MPAIDIPPELYRRLERHAHGFDTPAAVISRAVDALERQGVQETPAVRMTEDSPADFDAVNPPKLAHTKVLAASFDGKPIKPANWNRILDAAVMLAAKKLGDFDKVRKLAAVNIVKGEKNDEGYHFLPDAGLSVQGQDANAAWRGAVFIAQNLKLTVEVSFLWRNKEGAQHPGEPGTMRFG